MNDVLERYTRLKKRADESQQKADKAEGGLSQVLSQLKSKFNCPTLKTGEAKHEKLKVEEQELKEQFEEAMDDFEEKWPDISE